MAKMTRRSFALLTSSGILAQRNLLPEFMASAPAVTAADADGRGVFPYGTHVYREPHLPLQQLRHDFPLLKRLGFNMIKIQEVWEQDERREGEIDLSTVSQVVSDARQNGLRVYFGVTMEQVPEWLWTKFPDANLVFENGEQASDPAPYNAPADGKPGPCWNHPGARTAAIRFIEAVGREIGKYDNIEVWNVWQEIGFGGRIRPGHLGFCFCHNTLTEFRKWLVTRYGTVQNLNETWKSGYGDWEEIRPPRISPAVPATIDWRYFMDDIYFSEALKWKADAFRRSDPLHRPILAHVANTTPGSTREWRYVEQLDILGSSCYPGWRSPASWDFDQGSPGKPLSEVSQANFEVEHILMHFDHLRSAKSNGEIWTAELQGGPITEQLLRRRVPTPADIRRWVLSCLAAGSRGICYWNHRPEIFWSEGYGFSLLDWGSDTSDRAEEAGRLAVALNGHADVFAKGEHPQPSVAIVMNEDLYHWAEGSLYLAEGAVSSFKDHLQYTITGIWKALWREGIPTGFVESAAIPADASKVKALILPFPLALGQPEIKALSSYVHSGGVLISEACPGRFSNYGIGFDDAMAPGVSELFGAKHQGVFLIREPGKGAKWTDWKYGLRDSREYRTLSGSGGLAQQSVFPAFYLQTLDLTTAKPALMYGNEVAGCVNEFGRGKAYIIGTFLGHAGPAYDDWRNGAFLNAILAQAGVVADRAGNLNRRRRILGTRSAWFFFNSTETVVEEKIDLENFKTAHDLLGEELPQEGASVRLKVQPLDIRCILLET